MENSIEKLNGKSTRTEGEPIQMTLLQKALADSEQKNAELTIQLETLLNAFNKMDFTPQFTSIVKRLEASDERALEAEKKLREELTGRIAMNIEPYIDKTMRRVTDLNQLMADFEEKLTGHLQTLDEQFALQQEGLAAEGEQLVGKFTKSGDKLIAAWQNAQKTVHANLTEVNNYAMKMSNQITGLQNAQKKVENAGDMFAARINLWSQVTETLENRNIESTQALNIEQERTSLKIRLFGDKTVKDYKSTVFMTTFVSMAAILISMSLFWGLTYRRADSEIEKIKEFSGQEQQQIRQIFDESVKNANIRNLSDDLKLKLYPFLINKMSPEAKTEFDNEIKRRTEEVKRERETRNTQQTQISYNEAQKQPGK